MLLKLSEKLTKLKKINKMSIITPSIFVAEIAVPQSGNYFENGGNLQAFIDKYERKFMLALFGVTFYDEIKAGLAEDPIPTKWSNLVSDDLKLAIANYVYWHWKRDETTQSVGISETKPKAENSSVTNSEVKQVRAWNEMVDYARGLNLDVEVYPNWTKSYWRNYGYWYIGCEVSDIFYYQNSLNF